MRVSERCRDARQTSQHLEPEAKSPCASRRSGGLVRPWAPQGSTPVVRESVPTVLHAQDTSGAST